MLAGSDLNDTGLTNGQRYHYFVTAVSNVGESDPTEEISALPLSIPGRPTDLSLRSGYRFVKLSWELPNDDGGAQITMLRIYRRPSSDIYQMIKEVSFPASTYNDTSVVNGREYQYYVTALNLVGESIASNVVQVVPRSIPFAPYGPTIRSGDRFAHMKWDPPMDNGGEPVEGYKVFRKAEGEEYQKIADLIPFKTEYNDTEVSNGQVYYYFIKAFNVVGASPPSEEIWAIPMSVPQHPYGIILSAGDSYVDIHWSLPSDNGGSNLSSIILFRGLSIGLMAQIAVLDPDATSFNDTNVENGEEYFYALKAVNDVGRSIMSGKHSAKPMTTPGGIMSLFTVYGDGFALLMWGNPIEDGGSEITGYNIYRKDLFFNFTLIATVDGTTFTYNDTDIVNGFTYEYRIYAMNEVGEGEGSNIVQAMPEAPISTAGLLTVLVLILIILFVLILIIITPIIILIVVLTKKKKPKTEAVPQPVMDHGLDVQGGPLDLQAQNNAYYGAPTGSLPPSESVMVGALSTHQYDTLPPPTIDGSSQEANYQQYYSAPLSQEMNTTPPPLVQQSNIPQIPVNPNSQQVQTGVIEDQVPVSTQQVEPPVNIVNQQVTPFPTTQPVEHPVPGEQIPDK
jgi:fibronectin type 3 domain-containing protein